MTVGVQLITDLVVFPTCDRFLFYGRPVGIAVHPRAERCFDEGMLERTASQPVA